jgi:hypothetical protein
MFATPQNHPERQAGRHTSPPQQDGREEPRIIFVNLAIFLQNHEK